MEENGLSKLQVFYTFSRLVTILVFSRLRKLCLLQYFVVVVVVVVVVQSLHCIQLFATPWTIACQAPLSSSISWGLFKFMSIESIMPSNHLILCAHFSSYPQSFPASEFFQCVSSLQQLAKVMWL